MKWVLLLSLVVSLATGRTIFDYERDGLENKQKGLPGKSVTGQYEWRGPDGKVTEVSYVADHMGFRLLDDLELKPPTEPFRQAESTAQATTKYTSAFYNSEQEEEEEGEEEEEENETGEGETEEEEHEEEGDEEASESEAQEVERTAEQEEAEQEETDAAASEAETAESPKANEKEADATEKENENQDNENMGKDLEQSDATKKQLTTDDAVTKEQAFPEPSIDSEPVAEERVGEAEAPMSSITVLAPSKVESTSPEETSAILEPAFVDKTLSTVVAEPVFPAEAPVITTGELSAAEPIVAAELSAFASSRGQGPAEQSPIVAEIIPEAFAFSDTPLLAVEEIQSGSSTNSQPLIVSRDNDNNPSVFSEPSVIIIGSFSDESEDTIPSSNIQNAFERDERTVANNMQVQEQVSEPFVHPVLELGSFNTEVFPVAEPFQQPAVELEPLPTDVVLSPGSEPLQQPFIEVEAVSTDNAIPILPVFEVPEASVAKMLDVQPQETQSVPVIELEVPQQTAEAIQATPFEELPFAMPLQQVQILETANLPTPDVRPVETSPSAVFVREIELSETDDKPTLEIELTKHRFDMTKSSHPVDSATLLTDAPAHNSPQDLFFIPETFQAPDANPSQSSLPLIEIPAQEDMFVKAKMFSKLGEPMNSEFIRVTANELEKPTTILNGQISDSFNIIPVESPSVIGVNSEQFQSDFAFLPEQMLVKEPEITDAFILPLETPVSAPQVQEPLPDQATQQLVLTPAKESSAASLQVDNISVPIIELPVDVETEGPEDILFIRATEPLITENVQLKNRSPMEGPPLLPPMMKVPRLLL